MPKIKSKDYNDFPKWKAWMTETSIYSNTKVYDKPPPLKLVDNDGQTGEASELESFGGEVSVHIDQQGSF